tara:strand:- start:2598 stop:2777 length:180 start_codon:yes stop_codon:yes gene_type:complete
MIIKRHPPKSPDFKVHHSPQYRNDDENIIPEEGHKLGVEMLLIDPRIIGQFAKELVDLR